MVFRGFGGRKFASLKAQPAARIETFARFEAFHGFSWISSIFMVFRESGSRKFANLKAQPAAPIESFARFKAFHRFSLIS